MWSGVWLSLPSFSQLLISGLRRLSRPCAQLRPSCSVSNLDGTSYRLILIACRCSVRANNFMVWIQEETLSKGWGLVRDASTPALSPERFTRYSSCSVHSKCWKLWSASFCQMKRQLNLSDVCFFFFSLRAGFVVKLVNPNLSFLLADLSSVQSLQCFIVGQPNSVMSSIVWRALWSKWSCTSKHNFLLIMMGMSARELDVMDAEFRYNLLWLTAMNTRMLVGTWCVNVLLNGVKSLEDISSGGWSIQIFYLSKNSNTTVSNTPFQVKILYYWLKASNYAPCECYAECYILYYLITIMVALMSEQHCNVVAGICWSYILCVKS